MMRTKAFVCQVDTKAFPSAGKNAAAAHLCFKERLEITEIIKDKATGYDFTKVKALTVGSFLLKGLLDFAFFKLTETRTTCST